MSQFESVPSVFQLPCAHGEAQNSSGGDKIPQSLTESIGAVGAITWLSSWGGGPVGGLPLKTYTPIGLFVIPCVRLMLR